MAKTPLRGSNITYIHSHTCTHAHTQHKQTYTLMFRSAYVPGQNISFGSYG